VKKNYQLPANANVIDYDCPIGLNPNANAGSPPTIVLVLVLVIVIESNLSSTSRVESNQVLTDREKNVLNSCKR
jgi:hypothetical protein